MFKKRYLIGLSFLILMAVWAYPAGQKVDIGTFHDFKVPNPPIVFLQDGSKFIFRYNDLGYIDLWCYEFGSGDLIKLTNFKTHQLGAPVISPKGDALLTVKDKDLFLVFLDKRPPKQITSDEASPYSYSFSPDGEKIVYGKKGKIYLYDLKKEEERLLFKDRGENGSPTFSPCGRKIAFVSFRQSHSFIGLYSFEDDDYRFINPSWQFDRFPVFTPDGRYIIYYKIYDDRAHYAEVVAANLETGEMKKLFVDKDENRDWFQPKDILVTPDGRNIIISSEVSGYLHPYLIDIETGEKIILSSGEYEDENWALADTGDFLAISGNRDDINRRQIYLIDLKTKKIKTIAGRDINVAPSISPDGKKIAYLYSSPYAVQDIWLMNADGSGKRKITNSMPPGLTEKMLVAPKIVTYTSKGLTVTSLLFIPKNINRGEKRPAAIFLHGGPIRQMIAGFHYSHYYARNYAFGQYLVNKGYVVLFVNFRGGIGYGRSFRQSLKGDIGRGDYEDVLRGVEFLKTLPYVEQDKIVMWGGSYGGYLTMLLIARNSAQVAAGAALHGICDWEDFGVYSPHWKEMLGGGREKRPDLALLSSAINFVSELSSPIIMFHGDEDTNVPVEQSIKFARALMKAGKYFEFYVYPDEPHSFLAHEAWTKTFEKIDKFFDKFIAEKEE
jgi:dipeptidyl-peptidase-4